MQIEKVTDQSVKPRCGKCEKELDRILIKTVKGGILNVYNVAICPHCHTLLGYHGFNFF